MRRRTPNVLATVAQAHEGPKAHLAAASGSSVRRVAAPALAGPPSNPSSILKCGRRRAASRLRDRGGLGYAALALDLAALTNSCSVLRASPNTIMQFGL